MKYIFPILIVFILNGRLRSQDIVFGQYNSAPLYLNPAFTGSDGGCRFTSSFQGDWDNYFPSNNYYFNFSFDKYFSSYKSGLGINYLLDNNSNSYHLLSVMYSYHFQIKNIVVIQPGLSLGAGMLRYNFIDSQFAKIEFRQDNFADISTGIIVYNKFFTTGFSVQHLNNIIGIGV